MAPLPVPSPSWFGNLWGNIRGHSTDSTESYTPPSDLLIEQPTKKWESWPDSDSSLSSDHHIPPYHDTTTEISDHLHFIGQPGNLHYPIVRCERLDCSGAHGPDKAHYPSLNRVEEYTNEQGLSGPAEDNREIMESLNNNAMYALGRNPDIDEIEVHESNVDPNYDPSASSSTCGINGSSATIPHYNSLHCGESIDFVDVGRNDMDWDYRFPDTWDNADSGCGVELDDGYDDRDPHIGKRSLTDITNGSPRPRPPSNPIGDGSENIRPRSIEDNAPPVEDGEDDFWQLDKRFTGTLGKRTPSPLRTPLADITNIHPRPAGPVVTPQPLFDHPVNKKRSPLLPVSEEEDTPPKVEEGEDNFWGIGKRDIDATGAFLEKRIAKPVRTPLADITNIWPRPIGPVVTPDPIPSPTDNRKRNEIPQFQESNLFYTGGSGKIIKRTIEEDEDCPPRVDEGEDDFWGIGKRDALPFSDEDDKPKVEEGEDDFWGIGKRTLEKRSRNALGDITNIPHPPTPPNPIGGGSENTPPPKYLSKRTPNRTPFSDITNTPYPASPPNPVGGGQENIPPPKKRSLEKRTRTMLGDITNIPRPDSPPSNPVGGGSENNPPSKRSLEKRSRPALGDLHPNFASIRTCGDRSEHTPPRNKRKLEKRTRTMLGDITNIPRPAPPSNPVGGGSENTPPITRKRSLNKRRASITGHRLSTDERPSHFRRGDEQSQAEEVQCVEDQPVAPQDDVDVEDIVNKTVMEEVFKPQEESGFGGWADYSPPVGWGEDNFWKLERRSVSEVNYGTGNGFSSRIMPRGVDGGMAVSSGHGGALVLFVGMALVGTGLMWRRNRERK